MSVAKDKKFKLVDISMLTTHALSNVVSVFVSTFLISYIYSISNNYIFDIGLFYLINYLSMFFFYFLVSRIIDKTDRVTFYRMSILVRGVFIFSVIFLGQNLAKYIVLAGFLHGFSEACYWSSYNLMKNELISNSVIERYSLVQSFDTKGISVIVPLILGKIIDGESFRICAIIVFVAVIVQLIVSIFIKSKMPENSKFYFRGFLCECNTLDKEKRKLIVLSLIASVIYGTASIIPSLNTIMIMISFESNFSLGIFTSIFALGSMLLLIILKKFTKLGKRSYIYYICAVLPILATSLMLFNLNKTTVIIHTCIYTLSIILYEVGFDVMRNLILKKFQMFDSIAEYQCSVELGLETGRILIFLGMVVVGTLTAGFGTESLSIVMRIMCGVSILFVVSMNICMSIYEKKFVKNINIED